MMQVVVASRNPAKVEAVRAAYAAQFPAGQFEVESVAVDSGVRDQPEGDDETLRGARNRAANARVLRPEADFWVGLEGGIESIDGRLIAFAWMCVLGTDGVTGEARTVTLPLPPAVKALLDDGLELGDANDRVFGTSDSKQKGGAFGLLTGGLYTREGVYTEALTMALLPFVHDLYH
jgi:inosine/xanthosine triphosphatase